MIEFRNISRYCSRLLLVTSFTAASSLHAQLPSLQDGILSLPYVLATDGDNNETAYSAELSLLVDTDPVQFAILAAVQTPLSEDRLQSTLTGQVLFIPDIVIDGISYWVELHLVAAEVFELHQFGRHSTAGVSNLLGLTEEPVWQRLEGEASDIGVGADGSAWVIGTDERRGGYGIYHWNGSQWGRVEGAAVRIDVDPSGNPWIINDSHEIYRRLDNQWIRLPGNARDIGIGADGSAWVTSGGGTFRFNGIDWDPISGSATRIDVDPSGNPWVITAEDKIYQLIDDRWIRRPGEGRDIGIGADGSIWLVGTSSSDGGHGVYRWNGGGWNQVIGSLRQISAGPDGSPWAASSSGKIYRAR